MFSFRILVRCLCLRVGQGWAKHAGVPGGLVPTIPHQPAGLACCSKIGGKPEAHMLTPSQVAQYRYGGYLFPFRLCCINVLSHRM